MWWCYLWECLENDRRAKTHASLSSVWWAKFCSRITLQYLFLVGMTERNRICFHAVSWIAVVKITVRTRADLRHPAANRLWATLQWRRMEILPCWLYASSCCLLRDKCMGCKPLFSLRCSGGSRAQLLSSSLFQTVTNLFPESILFLI